MPPVLKQHGVYLVPGIALVVRCDAHLVELLDSFFAHNHMLLHEESQDIECAEEQGNAETGQDTRRQ